MPPVDDVFEQYLDEQLKATERAAADDIRRAARLAYYGRHYPRLYSAPPTTPGKSPLRTFAPTMPIANMDEGHRLFREFRQFNPKRRRIYLP